MSLLSLIGHHRNPHHNHNQNHNQSHYDSNYFKFEKILSIIDHYSPGLVYCPDQERVCRLSTHIETCPSCIKRAQLQADINCSSPDITTSAAPIAPAVTIAEPVSEDVPLQQQQQPQPASKSVFRSLSYPSSNKKRHPIYSSKCVTSLDSQNDVITKTLKIKSCLNSEDATRFDGILYGQPNPYGHSHDPKNSSHTGPYCDFETCACSETSCCSGYESSSHNNTTVHVFNDNLLFNSTAPEISHVAVVSVSDLPFSETKKMAKRYCHLRRSGTINAIPSRNTRGSDADGSDDREPGYSYTNLSTAFRMHISLLVKQFQTRRITRKINKQVLRESKLRLKEFRQLSLPEKRRLYNEAEQTAFLTAHGRL